MSRLINAPGFAAYFVGRPSESISGGPERIVTNEPDPNFKPRPVGFAADPPSEPECEPLLWDGDDS